MLNLFWIFEYVTAGPFAGPLSVNLPDLKSSAISVVLGILNFDPKI